MTDTKKSCAHCGDSLTDGGLCWQCDSRPILRKVAQGTISAADAATELDALDVLRG